MDKKSPTIDQFDIIQKISDYEKIEQFSSEYTGFRLQDVEYSIDPDNNFFSSTSNNCLYYTEDQFNNSIKRNDELSLIHVNSRSLYAHFDQIKDYLQTFTKRFSIIAISETWRTESKGTHFELDGYEMNDINRQGKAGGGVALFVDNSLKYRIVDEMTATLDNILECITIEITIEGAKNIIISCIYRTPGSNIEQFKSWIEDTFTKKNNNRMYICGDINIDLLNPNNHSTTDEFINT